ncbi:MAG: hypothetical protein JWQ24_2439 [Tardiphaga sp.]|nr:hypothetical protein [Tardiphaga sp.]
MNRALRRDVGRKTMGAQQKAGRRSGSEPSKLGRDPRRETAEEAAGQPAVIVDHDAGRALVQIWKHSNHIALAPGFANEKQACSLNGRPRVRGDDG